MNANAIDENKPDLSKEQEIELSLKGITGDTISLNVSTNMTISELKEKIMLLLGQNNQQVFIPLYLNGKTLSDDKKTIKDYEINEDNNTIHYIVRLRGGEKIKNM